MAEQTDDDMIILLTEEIRKLGETPTIDFAELDTAFDFPEGSTARLLDAAAQDAGYTVIRKGSTHAGLARRRIGRLTRA